MKIRLAVCLLILAAWVWGGCVSKNSETFEKQVKKWVPLGTKTAKAQKTMERKGFECNVIMHGSVFNTTDEDWLDCTRDQVWFHDWQARIIIKDGKVIGYGAAEVK